MDQHHDDRINDPLSGTEIRKPEFLNFKESGSGNHADNVFAQVSDRYAGKSIDTAGVFKYIDSQS